MQPSTQGEGQALASAASWVQNDHVGFNRCPKTDSNYTFIYMALCVQRAKHPFIHFFFKDFKFFEFFFF